MDINIENSLENISENDQNSTINVNVNSTEWKIGFDLIFINEEIIKQNKKYYRLYIRPSFDFEKALVENEQITFLGQSSKEGKVMSFIEILAQINGKNEKVFTSINKDFFKDFSIKKESANFLSSEHYFSLIEIPSNLIKPGQVNAFSFNSMLVFSTGQFQKRQAFNINGTILLNTLHKTFLEESNGWSKLSISNYITGYWNYDKLAKLNNIIMPVMYKNIYLKNESIIMNNNIEPKYSFYNTNQEVYLHETYLDKNLKQVLDLIQSEVTGKTIPELETEISVINKSGILEESKKYYNLNKINSSSYLENSNHIVYKPNFQTAYDLKSNKVISDTFGANGLILNPNIYGNLVLKHKLILKHIIINIENSIDVYSNYNNQISYEDILNDTLVEFCEINFNLIEWSKFNNSIQGEENRTEIMEFIRKHEKNIL